MTDINETETEINPVTEEVAAEVEVKEVKKKLKQVRAEPGPAVVSGGVTDDVYLDRCVFKNLYARKSLTVHHLQRRLAELGYTEVLTDKDGWYGDITRDAVTAWQTDNNTDATGIIDAATFLGIFKDDINVTAHA